MSDRFNAFVDTDPDAAPGNGPLAGVRVGIKSNIAVAGLPWTAGMGLRRGIIAERDAEVVARLRRAGAAILGTLNMHEAALGSTTDNPFYGRTINPHREGFTPGGSSGGSGAAVTAGLCDLALGTDTLGSVRIPAAYCGVYGLKPTAGAVPQDGLVVLDARLDAIGPLARDLDTLAAGWRTIADRPGEAVQFQRAFTLADPSGVELEPQVRDAWRRALAAIDLPRGQVELPASLESIRLAAFAGIGRAIAEDLGPDIDGDGISKELHFVINAALGMPFDEELLARAKSAIVEALGEDGVLVLPTAPQVAFAHTPRPPASQPLFTGLANVAGLPALACPAGRDDSGLPLSVQLIGPAGSEPGLIDLARRIEPALGGFVAPPAFQGEPQCA
ncbi:Glutamyl-tRNA(Gln) amidotransferase subunit A [Tsuneonella dongtanensis]|uniref:Glutamyl-tRNA(Gln) amidotransferase subunit A n=1 Tax=Tsuneonella dongtanensis TaxID=692370 RepID=A0A1B2AG15_9SPHN|nr:amidase [Tsuneonella dongtanensis]ANY21093.1 Glutamyl-tRNA(Gln) amidotransferase subunit A [Tsuneonella dongtanensis]